MRPLKIKIPSKKNLGRQRRSGGFNSGVKGLTLKKYWIVITLHLCVVYGCQNKQ
jgi:hypothetical protein